MKKTVLALIMVLMLSGAFAAYNPDSKRITLNFARGWNLIPFGFEGGTNITNDLLAVYVWIPTNSTYAGGIVKNGTVQGDNASDYIETLEHYAPFGFWVYAKSNFSVTSDELTNQQLFTGDGAGKKLAGGWNFVSIWPYMTEIKFNDLMGNCNITKLNTWNSAEQKWGQQTSSTEAANRVKSANQPFSITDVGKIILLYAESACEMGTAPAEALTPPALPA